MSQIPTDFVPDSTLALALNGYQFISKGCDRHQSDIFQTRLLFEKTICMRGAQAASVFYDNDKFIRQKAAPKRLQKTLFGEGGVQTLDGKAHRHRKQMFMALMTSERIAALGDLLNEQWQAYAQKWENMDRVVFFDEAQEVFCRAVCAWTGVPLAADDVSQRTRDFAAMIEASAAVGPTHWRGRKARKSVESWMREVIAKVRNQQLDVPEDSALYAMSWHRDLDGILLDSQIAAVEIINVLRPTVAIARYTAFAALALYQHSEWRQKLRDGDDSEIFVQEVRRFYPFFPVAAARVKQPFDWQGVHFSEGRRVLLDLYGTNHDGDLWENPNVFQPERFRQWNENPFSLIPQGGGDFYANHRCPGEWITIALMKVTVRFLTRDITYDVPAQDLEISLTQMPTLPKSGFVISRVRRI
jgi:fatty-acid peroxygenase